MRYKKCLQCNHPLHGRADKKFCDSYCRSQYHNDKSAQDNSVLKKIDRILRKNRKILTMLTRKSNMVITKSKLKELGYRLDFYTHQVKVDGGLTYYFCYDRAILPLDQKKVAVVRSKDQDIVQSRRTT
ncbi:MAG: hypothetical protein R3275_00465 [Saprospiraceae bacterium]|nr:hypothetical protein [Saprospiraceae bacterium]